MEITLETNRLLEKFWTWRLKNCPEFATFCGIHDYNDQLESFSMQEIEGAMAACQQFLKDALDLLRQPNLEAEAKSNLLSLKDDLETYLNGNKAKGYFFPITFFDGPQTEFERLIAAMPLNSVEDYNNVLSRYEKLPVQIDEMIDIMRLGMSQNMTLHKVSVDTVPRQISLLEPVSFGELSKNDCVFYKPFVSLPDSFTKETKEDLSSKAVNSIYKLLGAFKTLKDFLETEYFNHTRPEIGASTLPDGKTFYQRCLDFHLSCSMTPEQVHEIGLKEVDRISSEIKKVIKSLNLEMTVKDFSEKMRTDERFYFNDPEELVKAYKSLVFDQIYPLLPKIVKTIPKSKLEIRAHEPSMAGHPALYLAGSQDGKVPGVFYVNVSDCGKSAIKYDMVALSLHETVPGHHLQLSHIMEDKKLPSWRRFIEDRKYSLAPSRFSINTAFIEFWASFYGNVACDSACCGYRYPCFWEELVKAYKSLVFDQIYPLLPKIVKTIPKSKLDWSFDRAVNFMLDHTAISKGQIEREVKRYVSLPGQACAYKIGELKIKSLREEVEKALGPKFSVTEFHDMVLHNCGPLHMLEQKTKEFIEANT